MRNTTKKGTMALHLVRPFIALAENHGYPEARAFVRNYFGLSQADADDPNTRVPVQRVADLFSAMVTETGNRDLGLIGARFVEAEHMGIGEYLARSRPTVREALESGSRYTRLLGDGAEHGLEVDAQGARWRIQIDPTLKVHEAAYEFMVALGVLRMRRITGMHDLAPLEVHFMHDEPANIQRHKKLLGCAIRFGMPVTQVIISKNFLDWRLPSAEPGFGRLLERAADAMLGRLPPPGDTAAQVRALLSAEAHLRDASAEQIARQLGMGVRTLTRKLSESHIGYRQLIDEARKQVALRDLTGTARPISEIAYLLGFSSPQSFHRAFRRWTGTTAARSRER